MSVLQGVTSQNEYKNDYQVKKRSEDKQVNFRISQEEYVRLKQMADDAGMSVSGFVKNKALGIKTRHPKIAKQEALKIASELRKIGVNLNQVAKPPKFFWRGF